MQAVALGWSTTHGSPSPKKRMVSASPQKGMTAGASAGSKGRTMRRGVVKRTGNARNIEY